MDVTWQVFAWMGDKIDTPLATVVQALSGSIQDAVRAPLAGASILYIVLVGMLILSGRYSEAGPTLLGRVIRLAAITWLCTSASAYSTWVFQFFFVSLPEAITGAVSSGTEVGAAAIDKSFLQAWAVALSTWQKVDMGFSFEAVGQLANAITINLFVVIFVFAALIFCCFAFLVWISSRLFLGLYVIFGPILIAMALFPATKAVFERWIGNLVNQILLQGAVIVLLSMLISVQGEILAGIEPVASADANPWQSIQQILAGTIFYVVGAFAGLQLTQWAASIAGGLAFQTAGLAQAAFGWATGTSPSSQRQDQGGDKDQRNGKSGGSIADASGSSSGGGSISRQAGASIGD